MYISSGFRLSLSLLFLLDYFEMRFPSKRSNFEFNLDEKKSILNLGDVVTFLEVKCSLFAKQSLNSIRRPMWAKSLHIGKFDG